MKKLFTIFALCALLLSTQQSAARIGRQGQLKISGTVVSAESAPVAYATVVLLATDGNQIAGTVSDADGKFELTATKGTYTLTVSYMGYNDESCTLVVTEDIELKPTVLTESATQIETLTIRGNLIRREADRFVMNVAESPLATGRNTYEMLSLAPGVWVKDGDVQINGRGGVKIFINEREVRMTGTELMNYLKAMPAENIQKIEVYPMAGAEHDADNTSGIIKITVRRQRDDGVSGTVSMRGEMGWHNNYSYNPSVNINYNSGKLNLYGNASMYSQQIKKSGQTATETTDYVDGSVVNSTMNADGGYQGAGTMIGALYDINGKNSIGAEYNYWGVLNNSSYVDSYSEYIMKPLRNVSDSYYEQLSGGHNHSLTFNYLHRIDSLGSNMKIIGDFAQNVTNGHNNYQNSASNYLNDAPAGTPKDSLYYNTANSDFRIYALSAGVEKYFSPSSILKYGAKFTLADNYSLSNYYSYVDATKAGGYVPQTGYDRLTDYQEYNGALYASFSHRFKNNISVVAGLRGEYTMIPQLDTKYFQLFPNASVSVPLNPTQTVIVAAQYTRRIRRPSFWAMNPLRTQLSEYSYQVGNPDLKPTFTNDISLSGIFFYKYSLTVGAQFITDQMQQISLTENKIPGMEATGNPNTLVYWFENLSSTNQYYAAFNAPVTISKWWSLNLNATYVNMQQHIYADSPLMSYNMGYVNFTSSITLPKSWFIDIEGYYMSNMSSGNMTQLSQYNFGVTFKKRFAKDHWTASIGVDEILPTSNQIVVSAMENSFTKTLIQPNINRLRVNVSLSYNFQAGKMFRAKSVEKGATEDMSRISQGTGSK